MDIDWYWQPASAALVRTDTRVLLEKQPLPRIDKETFQLFPSVENQSLYEAPEDPITKLEGRLRWFWFMYGPFAKWSARGQDDRIVDHLPELDAIIETVAAFVSNQRPTTRDSPTTPLAQLRVLAREMDALHPALAAAGLDLPNPHDAYQCLHLAEQLHAEGWKPR